MSGIARDHLGNLRDAENLALDRSMNLQSVLPPCTGSLTEAEVAAYLSRDVNVRVAAEEARARHDLPTLDDCDGCDGGIVERYEEGPKEWRGVNGSSHNERLGWLCARCTALVAGHR